MTSLSQLIQKEDGQDLVEYGLLAAFVSIIAIAAVGAIGGLIRAVFVRIQSQL